MKKKNIFILSLFFIIALFYCDNSVYAATKCKSEECKDEIAKEKAKYENNNNVKLVCSYAVQDYEDLEDFYGNKNYYANYIYYNINEKTFSASSTIGLSIDELTYSYKEKRFIVGDAKDLLEDLNRCPRYSYIDFAGGTQICFDSDGTSCNSYNGYKFFGGNGSKIDFGGKENSILVDDLVSQYKNYNNTFSGACEEDNAMVQKYGNFCRYMDNDANYIIVYYNSTSSEMVAYNSEYNKKLTIKNGSYASFVDGKNTITYSNYINGLNSCPNQLYVNEVQTQGYNHMYNVYASNSGLDSYNTNLKFTDCSSKVPGYEDGDANCQIISDTIRGYINDVMTYIRIGVPILLLCLIIYDFASATFSSSEDKMKKAQGRVIKRIIIAIIIFFVPTLINLIFDIVNNVWSKNYQICGIEEYEK